MKYSEVLRDYQPIEIGDFMYRYNIKDREYIIYSPLTNQVSCLETFSYKDITPYQLAVYIQNVRLPNEELDEFNFQYSCSKNDLIKYLFDVIDKKTDSLNVRQVSNNSGYFLYELKPLHKIKNIYQFNSDTLQYKLVFDNNICYTASFENLLSDFINVCWNPIIFNQLENKKENIPTYLLPSSNIILNDFIYSKIQEKSAKIKMYIGNNYMNALQFFSYFINQKDEIEKKISVSFDNNNVTILMSNWQPVTLVRFTSKIQKIFNKTVRKIYEEEDEMDILFYQLEYVGDHNYILFPYNELGIEIFLKNIMDELAIEKITYA